MPVFALVKKILFGEPKSHIVLIYQNHDEDHVIFKPALHELEEKFAGKFRVISLYSKGTYTQLRQKLNIDLLEQLVHTNGSENTPKLFYLCGPASFMRMADFTLRWMSFSDEQIRKENFTFFINPKPPEIAIKTPAQAIIHFGGQVYQVMVGYPNTVLQAALDQKITLPFSCRSGSCATCVAKCLQGRVIMSNN